MRKLFFVLLLAMVYHSETQSQPSNPGLEITRRDFQARQVIPPSPEAAELGKYGNVPVSLFTGTPTVSIPLVELKGNFLSLPVSLSYNHTGLKPEEVAPWTGLGWALNAGGVITRSVVGDPDVDINYYTTPSPLDPLPADEYQKQLYYEQVRLHQLDVQPDVYYYNFMGHSGRFVISPGDVIIKKEKSYLKIVKDAGGADADFIITDEQGITYEFRAREQATMTTYDDEVGAPAPFSRSYISSWYLSKVIAPNGLEAIEFEYYSPTFSQSILSQSLTRQSVTYTKTEYETYGDTLFTYWESLPLTSNIYNIKNPVSSVYKKYIKKASLIKNNITIGYIDFESDLNARVDLGDAGFDGERMLKKVKLYSTNNSTNTLIREFAMSYAYFGISQPESPGYYRRLMLKTVREMSANNVVIPDKPPYTFIYDGESATMPGRYPSGLDHWGYYNGKVNIHGTLPTLVPTVSVPGLPYVSGPQGLGADREADPYASVLTVLRRINYPAGGYTTFEYEGNRGSGNDMVGGVRIREMIDHSFTDKPAIVKRYEYLKEDGSSSGEAGSYPNYVNPSTWEDLTYCGPNPSYRVRALRTWNATISASSTFGLGTLQGSHIGYRRVTEYQTDLATGQPLGKTVYTYDIQGFNDVDEHLGNGELLQQQTYDNVDKLLEEVTNTYTYEGFDGEKLLSRKIVGLSAQSNATTLYMKVAGGVTSYRYYPPTMCISPESGFGALYNVPSQVESWNNEYLPQRKKLGEQTHKIWDAASNNYLTTTRKFTYANLEHNYPTLTEQTSSNGEKLYTSVKYAADYITDCTPDPHTLGNGISVMQQSNMMGVPVEKLQYREAANGGDRRYISGSFTDYNLGQPVFIFSLESQPLLSTVVPSQAGCDVNAPLIDPHYRLIAAMKYDEYNNLIEEKKTDDLATTYLWGYNGLYPVAKVVGKTYEQTLTSGVNQAVLTAPADDNALHTELNKLRSLPGALITSYTYRPMTGITSQTDTRGRNEYYEYDLFSRLTAIKDHDGNIVRSYQYNYGLGTAPAASQQTLFYNARKQSTFTKQACATGSVGDEIVYTVPYGKYAAVTQTAADALADAEITANGQANANSTGLCRWPNAYRRVKVVKDDCLPEQGIGNFIFYEVPAGKYLSAVSQVDAEAMVDQDILTLGQAYANEHGTCSCGGEGQRVVNGVCETATRYHVSTVQLPDGQWECGYRYTFSDGFITPIYYYISPTPCPVDQ